MHLCCSHFSFRILFVPRIAPDQFSLPIRLPVWALSCDTQGCKKNVNCCGKVVRHFLIVKYVVRVRIEKCHVLVQIWVCLSKASLLHGLLHECPNLCGRVSNDSTSVSEGLDLVIGTTLTTGDDSSGVTCMQRGKKVEVWSALKAHRNSWQGSRW